MHSAFRFANRLSTMSVYYRIPSRGVMDMHVAEALSVCVVEQHLVSVECQQPTRRSLNATPTPLCFISFAFISNSTNVVNARFCIRRRYYLEYDYLLI